MNHPASIQTFIQAIYPLSENALQIMIAQWELVELTKGTILFYEGKTASDIYLIAQGIARAFCYKEDKELTFWFGKEGDFVLSYNSYIYDKPGYESIELLEDSVLYTIGHEELHALYQQNSEIANWGRKLAEQELVRTEERFISQLLQTATDKYNALLEHSPELLQRVPLGHIASFLGVTQVTLSRIRKKITPTPPSSEGVS
ncbi:Crp/Fnr family transcriptional regulator [Taibaiella soli]|uniref:Crp/Fnr family transcriptional regulator n=1 Tax=Taibaiella soli TaxID=1649169 RepID=UPI001A9E24F7|nr:Crp/Fnr family transcriptional regulator [Taibaiella soli]